jgi:hypothetical protein
MNSFCSELWPWGVGNPVSLIRSQRQAARARHGWRISPAVGGECRRDVWPGPACSAEV